MNRRRLLRRLLAGSRNVAFADFVNLVEGFGFQYSRTQGSHHIFWHPVIRRRLNLQPEGGQAKPYQIRQFLDLVEEHELVLEAEK